MSALEPKKAKITQGIDTTVVNGDYGVKRWCWHSWTLIKDTGKTRYRVCAKCGGRTARQNRGWCYQPIDVGWLETGQWWAPPARFISPPTKDTS